MMATTTNSSISVNPSRALRGLDIGRPSFLRETHLCRKQLINTESATLKFANSAISQPEGAASAKGKNWQISRFLCYHIYSLDLKRMLW